MWCGFVDFWWMRQRLLRLRQPRCGVCHGGCRRLLPAGARWGLGWQAGESLLGRLRGGVVGREAGAMGAKEQACRPRRTLWHRKRML